MPQLSLSEILQALEHHIAATPTSEKRNHLCDAAIHVRAAQEKK